VTSKVVSITVNDRATIALCADGSVWAAVIAQVNGQVALGASGWACLVEAISGAD
jgi:hypothetical protein